MATRISVIGTGYLGATQAAAMAELGYEVVGADVDVRKVEMLSRGEVPFYEPELEPLLRQHVDSGRLRFTTSIAEAADEATVHFVCVGTPQSRNGLAADVSFVDAAVTGLAAALGAGDVVVGKSTVPVGTAARLAGRLDELAPGRGVELVWNPEFLREGFAVLDTLQPDRIVLGARDAGAVEVVKGVYAEALARGTPLVLTDFATAELVKVSANAFLATKISFINAVAELCDLVGADVTALADAIGHDPRIGRKFLNAGLGFGGGCLPKDIRAFMARAGELGADQAFAFLAEVDAINQRRRTRVVELARQQVGGTFIGRRVAVLGAAFKPDSDDVRDSPALNVAGQIQLQGALVSVYDPKAMDNSRRIFPTLDYAASAQEACDQADVVLHLTEWKEFRAIDPVALGEIVRRRSVIDGRNCLDATRWRAAGWTYRGMGRP